KNQLGGRALCVPLLVGGVSVLACTPIPGNSVPRARLGQVFWAIVLTDRRRSWHYLSRPPAGAGIFRRDSYAAGSKPPGKSRVSVRRSARWRLVVLLFCCARSENSHRRAAVGWLRECRGGAPILARSRELGSGCTVRGICDDHAHQHAFPS